MPVARGRLESINDVARISEKVHPGWSRFYARVLRGGTVHVGEPVVLSPAEG